jgi:hypothetical protein
MSARARQRVVAVLALVVGFGTVTAAAPASAAPVASRAPASSAQYVPAAHPVRVQPLDWWW